MEAEGKDLNLVKVAKSSSNLLLTVPSLWYFCEMFCNVSITIVFILTIM